MPLVYNPNLPLAYSRLYWVKEKPLTNLIQDSLDSNKLNNNILKYTKEAKPEIKETKTSTSSIWKTLIRSLINPKTSFLARNEERLEKSLDSILLEMTGNKNPNDHLTFNKFNDAVEVVDAMRRRNKKDSIQFAKLQDNKKTGGKKRIKRSVFEKTLTDSMVSSDDEEQGVGRRAESSQDVRNNDKLTVNLADLNLNAERFEPNRDVTNSERPQFKILVPPPTKETHKYVPIFRDCTEKNRKSDEEELKKNSSEVRHLESEQLQRSENNGNSEGSVEPEIEEESDDEEIDKTVDFIDVDNSNSTKIKEINSQSVPQGRKSSKEFGEQQDNKIHITDNIDTEKYPEKSGKIRVSTEPFEEDNEENDDSNEKLQDPNLIRSSEEEKSDTVEPHNSRVKNEEDDEEEEEESKVKITKPEEPKFEALLFDIGEYKKPFNLDEFLKSDPIFKEIDIAIGGTAEKPILKSIELQKSELKLIPKSATTEDEASEESDSSEESSKPIENRSKNSKEEYQEEIENDNNNSQQTREVRENTDSHEETEEVEVEDNSNEDFLRSIFKKKENYISQRKPTMPSEGEREFLSEYFTKDIIQKLRDNPKEEEEGDTKDSEQEEEIYNTLSSILKKRGSNTGLNEKMMEKMKEKGESPLAYKSFWSLEYESPGAEGARSSEREKR